MVLNLTMLRDKAFRTSAMFARKVDPLVYADVLPLWDRWMALKLLTQSAANGQPSIASNLVSADSKLGSNLPPPTTHETDTLAMETAPLGEAGAAHNATDGPAQRWDAPFFFRPNAAWLLAGLTLFAGTSVCACTAKMRDSSCVCPPSLGRLVGRQPVYAAKRF